MAFAYGHFIFPVEGAGAVGICKAVPLIAKDCLYPVVSCEDACEGRVPEQRRLEELGEMDILSPRRLQECDEGEQ